MCHFDVTVEEGGAAPLRFLLFWFAVHACVCVVAGWLRADRRSLSKFGLTLRRSRRVAVIGTSLVEG